MRKTKLDKSQPYITQVYPNDFDVYGFVVDGQARPGRRVMDKHTGVMGKVSRDGENVMVSGTWYEIGGQNDGQRKIE